MAPAGEPPWQLHMVAVFRGPLCCCTCLAWHSCFLQRIVRCAGALLLCLLGSILAHIPAALSMQSTRDSYMLVLQPKLYATWSGLASPSRAAASSKLALSSPQPTRASFCGCAGILTGGTTHVAPSESFRTPLPGRRHTEPGTHQSRLHLLRPNTRGHLIHTR